MDEKEKKLREDLEFHLDTLRRNLEVVSMEDLKAKYAKPFKDLKDNICKTATHTLSTFPSVVSASRAATATRP